MSDRRKPAGQPRVLEADEPLDLKAFCRLLAELILEAEGVDLSRPPEEHRIGA